MPPEDRLPEEQIEDLFFAAADLSSDDRAAFLDRECAGDTELRTRVETLLKSDDRAQRNTLWQGSAMDAEARSELRAETELRIGQRLGAYRILRRLGAGGMGVVYEAVRDDKEFEKRVAIKLVQQTLASPVALERFRAERQILADLEHPNIARLLDGGTSAEGLPYLVMEFVEGQPLDEFARGIDRTLKLMLFREICSAVAYAHRHLIVHSDLKPGNILVTAEGAPKLLDFGIAQMMNRTAPELSGFALTPRYASPEQKSGGAISVASDVYSLGVLLSEIGGTGGDRDFEAIVSKAMRENPAERYASVDALAEDVTRHMHGRPVLARDQTIRYRTTKFVGRHRTATVLALVAFALVASAGIATWRSEERARRERDVARQSADTGAFQPGGPLAITAGGTTVRMSLDEKSVESLERLHHETPGDENVQRDLATAYQRLALVEGTVFSANVGNRGGARILMQKALDLREKLFAAHSSDIGDRAAFVETLGYLGRMAISDGDPSDAFRLHTRAWNESGPLTASNEQGPVHIAARVEYLLGIDLGGIGYSPHLGDPTKALVHHRGALALIEAWRASHPGQKTSSVDIALREELIAIDLARLMRFGESEQHIRRAVTVLPHEQPGVGTPGDPRTWCIVRSCYGWILTTAGKAHEAVPVLREAMGGAAKLVEADPKNVRAQLDLSIAEGALGRAMFQSTHTGIEHLHHAISSEESLLKEDPWHAELRGALARHYLWAGECGLQARDWNEARRFYQQAAALAAETSARQASDANAIENLASAHLGLAQAALRLGSREESAADAEKAIAEARRILSAHPENPFVKAILDTASSLNP